MREHLAFRSPAARPVPAPAGDGPAVPGRAIGARRVPPSVKLAYTAFCAAMVPTYLVSYGPTNFLYFCDEAVLLTLLGLWTGWRLPISMAAVGILVPQALWIADFAVTLLGHPLLGMTAYMFDARQPILTRALSAFHGWLPLLLTWLVAWTGYDRRALPAWTALATVSILVSFLFLPGPSPTAGTTPVNVDYVWGLGDSAPQPWMPEWAWLSLLLLGMPLLSTLPCHLLLSALDERMGRLGRRGAEARPRSAETRP